MSTRDQQARALDDTYAFLLEVSSGRHPLRPIGDVRNQVRNLLNHWPLGSAHGWLTPEHSLSVTETGPGATNTARGDTDTTPA